jgi:tRNA1Val (adenine37-N6)-methyltransferase
MSIFRLQQFAIDQSRSGMKICSDSLLFGALIPVDGAKQIIDIGTGTGILSLMQAQKCNTLTDSTLETITAIELTREAAEEAQENFNNSPWADQLKIITQDIQQFSKDHQQQKKQGYDVIICNPPFFAAQTKTAADNPLRHAARHTDTLSFVDLCQSLDRLLTTLGCAYLLLPIISIHEFCQQASLVGLTLSERIDIAESENHPIKVSVLKFNRGHDQPSIKPKQSRLNKFKHANVHSDTVRDLLGPFLLRYL